jgi:hypothetical protein
VPKHVKFGLFEAYQTLRHALAKNFRKLLGQYDLTKKLIAYVKHEEDNLNGMIAISKLVVNYEMFIMIETFLSTCFRHAFSKACQHSTYDERMSKGLKCVSIKLAQANLQKCITYLKKSKKGKHEWMKTYIITNLRHIKLNTNKKKV